MPQHAHDLALLERLAIDAGDVILAVQRTGIEKTDKSDGSPVTEADTKAEALILAGLAKYFPDLPVIAEEAVSAGRAPQTTAARFFLVDPLDGTREFVAGRPDFTVNIALIEDGVPVMGVIFAPAKDELYSGEGDLASFRSSRHAEPEPIRVRTPQSPPVALASRSHRTPETDVYIEQAGVEECVSVGSSLKFCWLARGLADLYPRFGRTMEWDTAAGDAILRAAGGETLTLDDKPLRYGKSAEGFANPYFISRARRATVGPR